MPAIPKIMRAAAIDRFGGPDVLTLHALPVPEIDPREVLIALHTSGVGVWDAEMREGRYVTGDDFQDYLSGEHQAILNALVKRDEHRATILLSEHLTGGYERVRKSYQRRLAESGEK